MKVTVRELSDRIAEFYPGRLCLSFSETAKLLGVDRRTVEAVADRRYCPLPSARIASKRVVPVTGLCDWFITNSLS